MQLLPVVVGEGEGGDQVQQQEEQEELGEGWVRERCVYFLYIFTCK